MDFGFVEIPAIVTICYLIGVGVKASPLDSKWIPLIMGGVGACLGCIGFLFVPGLFDTDILSAVAIGIASGLAATGTNQVYKQLSD
ncbi:MAG: phage holin family protein [Peptococcaceae bacterium]|nr:phage holin family protein [Peptococcaceae bacterium]